MKLFCRRVVAGIAICFITLTCIHLHASSQVAIIVNPSVDNTELSISDVRSIFTMRRRIWPNGERINVFVLSEDLEAHHDFSRRILGVLPRQLASVWQRLTYSGTGDAPVEIKSEQEMLQRVSQTPGAIGYLYLENSNDEVKQISVRN